MVTRVIEESRKACSKLEQHPLSADETDDLAHAIVISAFRRHLKRCVTSCAVLVSMSLSFPPTKDACNVPGHFRFSGRRQLVMLRGLYVMTMS